MARLRDLIKISDSPTTAGIQVGSKWVIFLVPLANWPEPHKSTWFRALRILTALDRRSSGKGTLREEAEPDEVVCLCHRVEGCAFKDAADTINPDCPRYIMGICVEATQQVNKTPLKLDTVGFLLGVSKQRIDQIYRTAVEKLVLQIQKDPVLQEYCASKGLKIK